MIGNKLEQSIIDVFQRNICSTYSINELSKILKKSYPNIHKKSKFFLNEGVLNKIDSGNSFKCYLDLSNEKAHIFMSINELNYREDFLKKHKEMDVFYQEIKTLSKKYGIASVLLNKGKLLIVLKDIKEKSNILRILNIGNNYPLIFLEKDQLQDYILSDISAHNDHIIFIGVDEYLSSISELKEKFMIMMLEEKKK